jgi:hypothetical protein
MTPRLRQLRADARACIACNVAAQIATRHRLPIERCRRWLLAKGGAVILLAVRRFRAIVSACGAVSASEITMPHATSSDIGFMAGSLQAVGAAC